MNTKPNNERARRAVEILDLYVRRSFVFALETDEEKKRSEIFKTVFGEGHTHLQEAYESKAYAFGPFYLNLDTGNKERILTHIFGDAEKLHYPPFPSWKEYAQKYFATEGAKDATESETRDLCAGFGDVSAWELFPEQMVWADKFTLYAENTPITGYGYEDADGVYAHFEAYPGDKFGSFVNWCSFWLVSGDYVKLAIAEKLYNY